MQCKSEGTYVVGKNSDTPPPPDSSDEAYTSISSSQMLIFLPANHRWYILAYEQATMTTDTTSSRFFRLVYMDLLLPGTPGLVDSALICDIYTLFGNLLTTQGRVFRAGSPLFLSASNINMVLSKGLKAILVGDWINLLKKGKPHCLVLYLFRFKKS
jgi:hypothetical protein